MQHPIIHSLNTANSIPEAFYALAEREPGRVFLSQAVHEESTSHSAHQPRARRLYSFWDVRKSVNALAHFLITLGLRQGDRVAILSNSRPEWIQADLAILAAGGVVVTVYQSLKSHEIGYILFDSETSIVFAENQEQVDKVIALTQSPYHVQGTEERAATETTLVLRKVIAIEEVRPHPLVTQFADIVAKESVTDPVAHFQGVKRGDMATIVYTSGTTGAPKGVVQTHGNHLSNVRQAFEADIYKPEFSIMLFLPLAHSFAKLMEYIGATTGVELKFPAVICARSSKLDPESITRDIQEADAEIVPVVPRILEKMHAVLLRRSHGSSFMARLMGATLQSAEQVYRARIEGKGAPIMARILYAITGFMRSLIRKRLFGRKFRNGISGGAKLNPEVNHFFESIGISILQGYGLTETCVATNVNRGDANRIGTVGPVLSSDIEMKIEADGEICYRGPNIAVGYWKRTSATRASWDPEGWFHTGDLGAVENGILSITGRKKELIVTAGGKKIAPEIIEAKIKNSAYVSQAVLVGEGKPFCCALVTLDEGAVLAWAKQKGLTLSEPISSDSRVKELLNSELGIINRDLASFESVKRLALLAEDFSMENGLMTPTFKVKRGEVVKRYAEIVEGLFRGE